MIFLAKKFHEGSFHSVHVKCKLQQLIIINYDPLDKIFAGSNLRTEVVVFFNLSLKIEKGWGAGRRGGGGG